MDERDLWVRAEWQRLVSTPERLRHFDVSDPGAVDLEVEEFVVRMLYAEFDSRSPSEHERPSTPYAPFMIEERYRVCGLLGFGGQARTWFARDERTGSDVALKELDLGRLQQWKSMQLFEREAEILARLDHPGVPHYIDSFKRQEGGDVTFFMAMEFVRGETLEEELTAQGSFSVEKASAVRDALFETLAYLHAFAPPVVHRDIKPSNIIRTPEGRIVLVDFGAVQASASKTMGGSTVVGTGGYAPIEQFMGKAVPASDLYALGATLTHLLTGVQPSELPTRENRIVFEQSVRLPQGWRNGLGALLKPAVERRPSTVEGARRAFDHATPVPDRVAPVSGGGAH